VDAPGPRSHVTLDPTDRRRDLDPHRLLVLFENPDRAREVAVTEPAAVLGGTGTEEVRARVSLNLSTLDMTRFSNLSPTSPTCHNRNRPAFFGLGSEPSPPNLREAVNSIPFISNCPDRNCIS